MRSTLCNKRKSHNIWLQIKTFDWNFKFYKLHCLCCWICPCLSCLFPCQYLDLSMFIMSIPLSILIFGGCHFSDIYKGFYFEQTNSLNLKVVLINFYLFLCNWHNVILTKILIATFQYMHCLDKKKQNKTKTLKAESINLYLKSHI